MVHCFKIYLGYALSNDLSNDDDQTNELFDSNFEDEGDKEDDGETAQRERDDEMLVNGKIKSLLENITSYAFEADFH